MKKIVKVEEIEGEGLVALLGERVELWCLNYIYEGILEGVNSTCCLLTDASIVYETGPFTDRTGYKDRQNLPTDRYVQLSAIESFALSKVRVVSK